MLNQETINIIKSTVPVLEVHGEAITTRFYQLLFANHPELLNIFNHANQKQGRQQRALAGAVYAAATYIDNLEAIMPVVVQIAHKHRSLGIMPEHYPFVGQNLIAAIKDVLGDAATDDIIDAWTEAYGVIADAFISVEAEMYREAEEQRGGWEGYRRFIVANKAKESDLITSFYLKPEDGKPIASYQAGQYISVKVEIEGSEYTHIRQYSLSDAPGKDYYRISVKREPENGGKPEGVVSNYLHRSVQEGAQLLLSSPAGDFILDTDSQLPLVLISGGVGLTPMVSMAKTAVDLQPARKVTFIHATINSNLHAMGKQIQELSNANENMIHYVCYEKPTEEDRQRNAFHKEGYIDLNWLKSILPDNQAEFYFCGPLPFMKAINGALKEWGVPEQRIHFEFFGPKGSLEQ